MKRLRNDPECERLSDEELACMSGFGNFRSYIRVQKMFGKKKK